MADKVKLFAEDFLKEKFSIKLIFFLKHTIKYAKFQIKIGILKCDNGELV